MDRFASVAHRGYRQEVSVGQAGEVLSCAASSARGSEVRSIVVAQQLGPGRDVVGVGRMRFRRQPERRRQEGAPEFGHLLLGSVGLAPKPTGEILVQPAHVSAPVHRSTL